MGRPRGAKAKANPKSKPKANPDATPRGSSLTMAARELMRSSSIDQSVIVKADLSILDRSHPVLSSRSVKIDHAIGGALNGRGISPCPGLPVGHISQIYGGNSTGKTTLALQAAVSACEQEKGTACYIDSEFRMNLRYAANLGVPVFDSKKFMLIQPHTLEEMHKIAIVMAISGVNLIIIDSVGAGTPQNAIGDPTSKEAVGERGRLWGAFWPRFRAIIARNGVTAIAISQTRSGMNAGNSKYGKTKMGHERLTFVQGGNAIKFYASLRIYLEVVQKIKEEAFDTSTGEQIKFTQTGTKVMARIDKCSLAPSQGAETTFYLMNGIGIDNLRSMVEIAVARDLVSLENYWYAWNQSGEDSIRAKGLHSFMDKIESEGLVSEFWDQVRPLLYGANTI